MTESLKERLEATQRSLEEEVKNHGYTYENPFGNAASMRKLLDFMYWSCMNEENPRDYLLDLYKGQNPESLENFKDSVETIITVLDFLKGHNRLA